MTALHRYRAHAKINLGLEVLGKRPDGYHEVRTVLQSIALCDIVEVHPAAEEIVLTCSDPNLGTGEENLVMKAARTLQAAFDCAKGARIHLTKRIPMQAGLGGGSSDAAVTLLALAHLWRLPVDPDSLMPLARTLGSDVPYFLVGGTVLAVGRGEEVYPLPDAPHFHLLVIRPVAGMSTAEAYSLLDSGLTEPRAPNRIMSIVQKLVDGKLDERLFFNRFEEVATRRGEEGAALRQALLDSGASLGMLAGSGASWVGIFPSRTQAQEAYRRMAHRGISGLLTSTISRRDYWELTQPRMGKENLP